MRKTLILPRTGLGLFIATFLAACSTPGIKAWIPDRVNTNEQSFEATALYHGAEGYEVGDITLAYHVCSILDGNSVESGTLETSLGSEQVEVSGVSFAREAARATVPMPQGGWRFGDAVDLEWRLSYTKDDGTSGVKTDESMVVIGWPPFVRLRQLEPHKWSSVAQKIDAGETLVIQAHIPAPLDEKLEVLLTAKVGGAGQVPSTKVVTLTIPKGLTESESYSIGTHPFNAFDTHGLGWIKLELEASAAFGCYPLTVYKQERTVHLYGSTPGGVIGSPS